MFFFRLDLECSRVLQELEEIDDELDDFGIPLVTTIGIKYAGTVLKVRKFPSLGLFRNGQFLLHEGSLVNKKGVVKRGPCLCRAKGYVSTLAYIVGSRGASQLGGIF